MLPSTSSNIVYLDLWRWKKDEHSSLGSLTASAIPDPVVDLTNFYQNENKTEIDQMHMLDIQRALKERKEKQPNEFRFAFYTKGNADILG